MEGWGIGSSKQVKPGKVLHVLTVRFFSQDYGLLRLYVCDMILRVLSSTMLESSPLLCPCNWHTHSNKRAGPSKEPVVVTSDSC